LESVFIKELTISLEYDDDDDIGLRIYQKKVQNGIPKDEVRKYKEYAEYYIDEGVISEDAKILAHFSILIEFGLDKAEIDENLFDDVDDMHRMYFFKVNDDGHIIELYLHHTEEVYLTILPRILCSLKYLEVIFFPNNLMKKIPECITNLKFLRVLDVRNSGSAKPEVPDSIKPFIESLESFNESHRY